MVNPPTVKDLINIVSRLDEDIMKFSSMVSLVHRNNLQLPNEVWGIMWKLENEYTSSINDLGDLYELLLDTDTE